MLAKPEIIHTKFSIKNASATRFNKHSTNKLEEMRQPSAKKSTTREQMFVLTDREIVPFTEQKDSRKYVDPTLSPIAERVPYTPHQGQKSVYVERSRNASFSVKD